jgi:hypothetical protein
MVARLGMSQTCTVEFPMHSFTPEDFLVFVELEGFWDDWCDLGLDDEDLLALQVLIMIQPSRPPVIPGTGGLRKIRFAPARWKSGKSGAIRVCYVFLAEHGVVLLAVPYSKREMDDLSAAHKKAYREIIRAVRNEYSRRPVK